MEKSLLNCLAAAVLLVLSTQVEVAAQPDTRAEVLTELAWRFDRTEPEMKEIVDYAEALEGKFAIPVSVIMSVMLLESAGGSSELSRKANNYFGLTQSFDWTGDLYKVQHADYIKGRKVKRQVNFRAYDNWRDSMNDFILFLYNPRRWWYNDAWECPSSDWECIIDGLTKKPDEPGFATDPKWNANIKRTVRNYGLEVLDREKTN